MHVHMRNTHMPHTPPHVPAHSLHMPNLHEPPRLFHFLGGGLSLFHFLGGVLSFFAFFGEGCFLLLDSSCWVLIEFFGRGSNVEIAPSNLRGFDKFVSFGFGFSVSVFFIFRFFIFRFWSHLGL